MTVRRSGRPSFSALGACASTLAIRCQRVLRILHHLPITVDAAAQMAPHSFDCCRQQTQCA
jgi:hypothetical protein